MTTFREAERTQASMGFACPAGLQPCSADYDKPGSTFCVEQPPRDCPITYLGVFDFDTVPANMYNPESRWGSSYVTKFIADGESAGIGPIIVYSRTDGATNTPLQQVFWSAGEPCAYSDEYSYYGEEL